MRNNRRIEDLAVDGAREFLMSVAIVIEAAGSIDRAVQLGLLGGEKSPVMNSGLRDVVPASRGGASRDPDAETKWSHLLATALIERGMESLAEVEAMVNAIEKTGQPFAPVLGAVEALA